MPASLRFAQILLAVGAAAAVVATVVVLGSRVPIPSVQVAVIVFLVGAALYALVSTVLALQREAPWAPVAAFWGLALAVLGGIMEILEPRPPGVIPVPVLGILAVIAIIALPSSARTVVPEGARLPPRAVTLAYVIVLIGTFIVRVEIDI